MTTSKLTVPNILSFFRMAAGPGIICMFFLYERTLVREILWVSVYIIACATDYFDGVIARAYPSQASRFGEYIDQFADKVLIGSLICFIVFFGNAVWWELVFMTLIVLREIRVGYIRGLSVEETNGLPSSTKGQWKTGFQMVAVGFILGREGMFADIIEHTIPHLSFNQVGSMMLTMAIVLTIWSWYGYEQKKWSRSGAHHIY
ncbi:CDP-alcohol phosphatidyltransferase family protein [Candidatus Kaiserbacteria bacterium]|nr:CDP-alcohol phosphatidyltransferase family protein [Candidatus Kaiserbacteria bacterium]